MEMKKKQSGVEHESMEFGMLANCIFYTFVVGVFLSCLMNIWFLCGELFSGCKSIQALLYGIIIFVYHILLIIMYRLYKRAHKQEYSTLKKHLIVANISSLVLSIFLFPLNGFGVIWVFLEPLVRIIKQIIYF